MLNTKNNRIIYYTFVSILVITILYFEFFIIPGDIKLLNTGEISIVRRINAILIYLTVAYFVSGFLIFKKLINFTLPNKITLIFRLISIVFYGIYNSDSHLYSGWN